MGIDVILTRGRDEYKIYLVIVYKHQPLWYWAHMAQIKPLLGRVRVDIDVILVFSCSWHMSHIKACSFELSRGVCQKGIDVILTRG